MIKIVLLPLAIAALLTFFDVEFVAPWHGPFFDNLYSRADVIVATGEGTPSTVRVYLGRLLNGSEPKSFQELDPFSSLSLLDGTFVG